MRLDPFRTCKVPEEPLQSDQFWLSHVHLHIQNVVICNDLSVRNKAVRKRFPKSGKMRMLDGLFEGNDRRYWKCPKCSYRSHLSSIHQHTLVVAIEIIKQVLQLQWQRWYHHVILSPWPKMLPSRLISLVQPWSPRLNLVLLICHQASQRSLDISPERVLALKQMYIGLIRELHQWLTSGAISEVEYKMQKDVI